MQDLTGKFAAPLTVSSMSGGNTQADPESARIAMTAPGSTSIEQPSPTSNNVLHIPEPGSAQIPVSHPGMQEKVRVQPAREGAGRWDDAHTIPGRSGGWKETS